MERRKKKENERDEKAPITGSFPDWGEAKRQNRYWWWNLAIDAAVSWGTYEVTKSRSRGGNLVIPLNVDLRTLVRFGLRPQSRHVPRPS